MVQAPLYLLLLESKALKDIKEERYEKESGEGNREMDGEEAGQEEW